MPILLLKKKKKGKKKLYQVALPNKEKGVVVGVQASSGQPNPALWFQLPKNQTSTEYIYIYIYIVE